MKRYQLFFNIMIALSTIILFVYAIFRDEIRLIGFMNKFLILMIFIWSVTIASYIILEKMKNKNRF